MKILSKPGNVDLMREFKLHWRGRIPLANVTWNLSIDKELRLPDHLEIRREEIWKEILEEHPSAYDGSLLVLSDYTIKNSKAHLKLSYIAFSRILTLVNTGHGLDDCGTLGFQSVIFSPNREHFIFGQRSEDSMYCPLFYALPGGMLEVKDTKGSVEQACLREINEEVNISLAKEMFLVGIMDELQGNVGTAIIIEGVTNGEPITESTIYGNEEWIDHMLEWRSPNNLEGISEENSLEGLVFVKEEWERHKVSSDSVLWDIQNE